MKRIALLAAIIAIVGVSSVCAQSTVVISTPMGNAAATYKNTLKLSYSEAIGGFTTVSLSNTNANVVDSIAGDLSINRTDRTADSITLVALQTMTGADYLCYSTIDERNGRLNVEAMLINCNTGRIEKILSRGISRNVIDVRNIAQILAKELLF